MLYMFALIPLPSIAYAAHIAKNGEMITIVTVGNRARLCPNVDCGQDKQLLRIPTGTKLKVEAYKVTSNRLFNVIWYTIVY